MLRAILSDVSRAACVFALCTTLRRGEVVSLRWEDVDLPKSVIVVRRTHTGKRSKTSTREVPLLPAAVRVLEDLGIQKAGRIFPMRGDSLTQAWGRACLRAGVTDARLHDCRRESVSRLIQKFGLTLEKVAVFSGHRDIRTLQEHYVRLEASDVAAECARMDIVQAFVPTGPRQQE